MKAKLGSGARFASFVKKLKKEGGVKDPAAVAAAAGMKKYGKGRMLQMARAGRK